jgi:hypothetical protein
VNRSRRPVSCPHQMPAVVEAALLSITGEHLTAELDRLAAQRGAFPLSCVVTTDPN